MKTPEQIREAAEEYASEYYDKNSERNSAMPEYMLHENRKHNFISGYEQALSDMKEGVDVEKIKTKWYQEWKNDLTLKFRNRDNILNFFLPYIHQPAQESEWISVEDRMPTDNIEPEQILVYTGKKPGATTAAGVFVNGKFFNLEQYLDEYNDDGTHDGDITSLVSHWMPLPKVPSTQTQK